MKASSEGIESGFIGLKEKIVGIWKADSSIVVLGVAYYRYAQTSKYKWKKSV